MDSPASRVLIRTAIAMLLGATLGMTLPHPTAWLGVALFLGVLSIFVSRARYVFLLLAITCTMSAYTSLRADHVPADHICRWLTSESQLARVQGHVIGEPFLTSAQRGAFGEFAFSPPGTLIEFELSNIEVDKQMTPVTGRLLVKVEQVDTSFQAGDELELLGWLAAIDGPSNPGEIDYREMFDQYGISGRLTLKSRNNALLLHRAPSQTILHRVQIAARRAADRSLAIGMQEYTQQIALLRTMLLGRRDVDLDGLDDSFREVGLAHLLAISGAHLGVLIGLTWITIRFFVAQPPRAALLVLAVLILYLIVVPARVPILRAGVMAGALCLGYLSGRQISALAMLAVSGIIVLLWRPMDVSTAGFQLSFGVVTALLIFTKPVSHWLWPDPIVETTDRFRTAIFRFFADFVAVNLVAFLAASPLVAMHFQILTPWAAVFSILATPVLILLLGLGYLKIAVGLLLPSGGIVLAPPTAFASQMMAGLVRRASEMPMSSISLPHPPSLLWTVACVMFVVGLLRGMFTKRHKALVGMLVLLSCWYLLPVNRYSQQTSWHTIRVNMFAVGNGSCFLVEYGNGHTLMFDCGSQQYLDVGVRSIAPALKSMNIQKLDQLVISHADLDHYSGVLDVMDRVPVGEVLTTPQLMREAAGNPGSAVAFLVDGIRSRGVAIKEISKGYSQRRHFCEVTTLWPPADYDPKRANDSSIVLRFVDYENTLLLTGDIQQEAITQLLGDKLELDADVTDLPHHGSFVDASPVFLDAVSPTIVLQSSGIARLRHDKWEDAISTDIQRLVTAKLGMVTVTMDPEVDPEVTWHKADAKP